MMANEKTRTNNKENILNKRIDLALQNMNQALNTCKSDNSFLKANFAKFDKEFKNMEFYTNKV